MKRNNILALLTNPVYVILLLSILYCIIAFNPYMAYDEGLWTYVGWLFNEKGIPPYVGTVENKTPAIFLLYTLANNFGEYNILFVRIMGVIATVGTTFLIFRIGRKLADKLTAIIAMWIFGLTSCWHILDGFAFAQTEVYMLFFSTLAFYIILKCIDNISNFKWIFLVGLSLGMAINFKQIAVTTTLAVYLIMFFQIRNLGSFIKQALILSTGVLLSLFFCYIILYFNGVSFVDYIEGSWSILFNPNSRVDGIESQLSRFIDVFFLSRMVLFLPAVLLFIFKRSYFSKSVFIFLFVWLLFDFIGANASGYYYGHQIKQLLPVLSLLTSIILTKIYLNNSNKEKSTLPILVFLIIILLPLWELKSNFIKITDTKTEASVNIEKVIDFIQKNSNSDDYIYILGADVDVVFVQAEAERISSSKYFHSIFISTENERKHVFNDLKKNTPKFILRHEEFLNIKEVYGLETESFFKENYNIIQSFGNIEVFAKL